VEIHSIAMALVADVSSLVAPNSRAYELHHEQKVEAGPTTSYVHHLVEVEPASQKGLGLFAKGVIQEGEVVSWESAEVYQGHNDNRPGKKLMTWAQIEGRWADKREREHFMAYSYQVGEDLFLIPLREDDLVITTYQNHSCDPNTWWADDFTLVARRTINTGEEVTFDYSTSESLENPEMPECFCGSPQCRKKLEPLDYLKPELVEKYGDHWVSYLRDRQKQHFGDNLSLRNTQGDDLQTISSTEQAAIATDNQQKCCDENTTAHSDENTHFHGRKS